MTSPPLDRAPWLEVMDELRRIRADGARRQPRRLRCSLCNRRNPHGRAPSPVYCN